MTESASKNWSTGGWRVRIEAALRHTRERCDLRLKRLAPVPCADLEHTTTKGLAREASNGYSGGMGKTASGPGCCPSSSATR
jgi:hypothetical protein